MGRQIAGLLYLGGFNINIWSHSEIDESLLTKQIKILKRNLKNTVDGKYNLFANIEDLPDAITIESITEEIEIKRNIFNELKHFTSPYFTNSSSYAPSEINERVNGLHFFNPINLGIVELYLNQTTNAESIKPIIDYLLSIGFEIIHVNNNRGYIGNYILFNEISSALKLIEKHNYTIDQVNAMYRKLYDGRNIFSIIDIIGIDVVYKILLNLNDEDNSIYVPTCLSKALKLNVLGKKNKTSIRDIL